MKQHTFTPLYGLSRSFMAFGMLSTLIFTHPKELFVSEQQFVFNNAKWNFFYILGYENIYLSYCLAICILILVISGYFPKFTGVLHTWLAYSFLKGSIIIEGGDQLAVILCLLMLPMTLFDKRKNHWLVDSEKKYHDFIIYFTYIL